jgi:hypothetical protein
MAVAQIHSPAVVSLPVVDHNVKAGSLTVPATLAVNVYPRSGAKQKEPLDRCSMN